MRTLWFSMILMLPMTGLLSGCQKTSADIANTEARPSTISTPILSTGPTPKLVADIRHVDFANFTFPWTKDQFAPALFTLKDGKKERNGDEDPEATLQRIEFGDLTNDGEEEAMISIYPYSGGNCLCYMVYVYTLKDGEPQLLWSFDTGDRAEGGFKRTYADKGKLVIELFGDDKFENGEWKFDIAEGKFNGLCCPTTFTRFHFNWNGQKFVLGGKPELFDWDWKKHQSK